MPLRSRIKRAYNAFKGNSDPPTYEWVVQTGSIGPPNTHGRYVVHEIDKTVVSGIYNRIANDVANVKMEHVRLDDEGNYLGPVDSGLNNCLQLEANLDQSSRQFFLDIVLSMFDEGNVAVIPIDTNISPIYTNGFDIRTLRVGKITQWFAKHIEVECYNEETGLFERLYFPKNKAAIIENPFYTVMNEPNGTLQRLIRKLAMLDITDDRLSSGKLDILIHFPYAIKSPDKEKKARERVESIEAQLSENSHGIAYVDGTERITQLNRPIENQLLKEVELLTQQVFNQLGMTDAILKGTADENEKLNYYNSTIEPILSTIALEFKRKFLSKTARTQKQSIMYFKDPFKLVPVNELAEIADKFTRNEILSSNEVRGIIGFKPVATERANELSNKNLPAQDEQIPVGNGELADEELSEEEIINRLNELDEVDAELDELEAEINSEDELDHYASPYYDPVKAHEYYMQNRELIGRKSTAKLNDEGKAAAKYVKKRLNEEKKGRIAVNTSMMKQTIQRLRERLKKMDKKQKAANKTSFQNQIEQLRYRNSQERERLKKIYDERYIAELDKMRADPALLKSSKKSKKTK